MNELKSILFDPISGGRYLGFLFLLIMASTIFGFGLLWLEYDSELWSLMKDPAFKHENSFQIAAAVLTPLFLALQFKRINSFFKHHLKSLGLVMALFAFSIPFEYLEVKDTYYIHTGVSVLVMIWLVFFNAQPKQIDTI